MIGSGWNITVTNHSEIREKAGKAKGPCSKDWHLQDKLKIWKFPHGQANHILQEPQENT